MNLAPLVPSSFCNWHTPKAVYSTLDAEFHFTDDPCPEGGMFGLDRAWGLSVFCNPPYGRGVDRWVEKGIVEVRSGSIVVVFLLPARTDTRWFHDLVLPNAEVRFLRGRQAFTKNGVCGRCPFPSMVAIFR